MPKVKPAQVRRTWLIFVALTLIAGAVSWGSGSRRLGDTAQFLAAIVCLLGGWLSGYRSAVRDAGAVLAADIARRDSGSKLSGGESRD